MTNSATWSSTIISFLDGNGREALDRRAGQFARSDSGAVTVEYAALAGLVGVAVLTAMFVLGADNATAYDSISIKMCNSFVTMCVSGP